MGSGRREFLKLAQNWFLLPGRRSPFGVYSPVQLRSRLSIWTRNTGKSPSLEDHRSGRQGDPPLPGWFQAETLAS